MIRSRDIVTASCIIETTHETQDCGGGLCVCSLTSTTWTEWGACAVTCGGGVVTRSRMIVASSEGLCLRESLRQQDSCNTDPCPILAREDCSGGLCSCSVSPTQWTEWSECSAICGPGLMTRSRDILISSGSLCYLETIIQAESCGTDPESCTLKSTEWTTWDPCPVTCGGGETRRTRDIILGSGSTSYIETVHQLRPCNTWHCKGLYNTYELTRNCM